MKVKTKGQIEQEQAMQASGLLREEIALLYEECREKLDEVDNDLMDIAQDRADISQEFINRVFRAFHSVKGAAAYLLHEPMKRLSHTAESVLGEVREGKVAHTAHLVEAGGQLPVMISFVDTDEHVNRVLPKLREMAAHRLIVRENVVIEQGSLD